MMWRVEAEFTSKMGSRAWVKFAGDFETRAMAEAVVRRAGKRPAHPLRVVEVRG
jgi:hypothetical protein